jgi:DNA-directed RNA polymerase subunit M/transcription elongation factor TFIIS
LSDTHKISVAVSPQSNEPRKTPSPTPAKVTPKCRRCDSAAISVMGRMEQSKETLYRCGQCGFVFTTN